MQHHAFVAEFLDQRQWGGGAANRQAYQMGEIGIGKTGRLGHHQEVGWHAQDMAEQDILVAQQGQEPVWIEASHHNVAAADMKDRICVDVEAAGVKSRQEHQVLRSVRQRHRHGALHCVVQTHFVGVHCALGSAGRAGGIHDGPGIARPVGLLG